MEEKTNREIIRENDDLKKIAEICEKLTEEDRKKVIYFAVGMAAAYESREAVKVV